MPLPAAIATVLPVVMRAAPDLAPAIAKALLGNRGAALGERILAIGTRVTGVADPIEMIKKVEADPDARLELSEQLHRLDVKAYEAEVADRADARKHAAGFSPWTLGVLVGMAWLALLASMGTVFFNASTLDPLILSFVSTVAGVLLSIVKDIYSFFFGSSIGSKQKSDDAAGLSRELLTRASQPKQESVVVTQPAPAPAPSPTEPPAPQKPQPVERPVKRDFVGEIVSGRI